MFPTVLSKTALTKMKMENLGQRLSHNCDHLNKFVPFVNKTFIMGGVDGQAVNGSLFLLWENIYNINLTVLTTFKYTFH